MCVCVCVVCVVVCCVCGVCVCVVCVCVCEMRSATFGKAQRNARLLTLSCVHVCVMSNDNDNDRGRFLLVLCYNHITLLLKY